MEAWRIPIRFSGLHNLDRLLLIASGCPKKESRPAQEKK
ncbi:hypothetical protein SFMTTN_2690 [Sulfuriferula multivorans]|uniref:Uncharacterized protein n=1 Tax=Sulfuriferula multivorans TaxID=1559896 RepID=A0A401JGW9_9PROT|nr:hypothetical protein SFMTTN_2690 [Sulfuriferula multivorans]